MVVGSTRVKVPDLQKSLAALSMVDADVLGVVMNFLPTKGPDAYSYTYYTSDSPEPLGKRPKQKAAKRGHRFAAVSDFDDRVIRGRQPVARNNDV